MPRTAMRKVPSAVVCRPADVLLETSTTLAVAEDLGRDKHEAL